MPINKMMSFLINDFLKKDLDIICKCPFEYFKLIIAIVLTIILF